MYVINIMYVKQSWNKYWLIDWLILRNDVNCAALLTCCQFEAMRHPNRSWGTFVGISPIYWKAIFRTWIYLSQYIGHTADVTLVSLRQHTIILSTFKPILCRTHRSPNSSFRCKVDHQYHRHLSTFVQFQHCVTFCEFEAECAILLSAF